MHFRFSSAKFEKWKAATICSALLSDYKILGTTSFFCMNSLRNRGWYPAHVHPFSSGHGNADVKTKNHNTWNIAEIDPHWGHRWPQPWAKHVNLRSLTYVALTPGHPEPRRENRVAVPAGDVAAGGGGAFRAFLGSRHEESRIQCKNQKSHPERCWDRHRSLMFPDPIGQKMAMGWIWHTCAAHPPSAENKTSDRFRSINLEPA